ncbi:MAG: PAS domain S-box protein [Parcubacteria group bacterium]|nr:PAS domain S-box protein [Parcubacteria group bacterium]
MTIRKRVFIGFAVFCFVLALMFVFFIRDTLEVRKIFAQSEAASIIANSFLGLALVSGDFLQEPTDSKLAQWNNLVQTVDEALMRADKLIVDERSRSFLRELREHLTSTTIFFGEAVALYRRDGAFELRVAAGPRLQFLSDSIFLALHESGVTAFELDRSSAALLAATRERAVRMLYGFGALLFAVFGVGSWYLLRIITRPLFQLVSVVQKIGRGDLTQRATVASDDEFGVLAREFNKMLSLLQTSQTDLRRFKQAVDGASEQMIITDTEGIILYANQATERITGYARGEVIGKKPSRWGGRMPREYYVKLWETIKEKKQPFSGDVSNVRKSGEKYTAHLDIYPVLDETKTVLFFVGIERDITKERRIDELKNEFISIASHQLRTPLTATQWVIERLLKKEHNLSESGRAYLNDIRHASKRLSELVTVLLNASRLEEGSVGTEPQKTDVIAILNELLLENEPLRVHKNIAVSFAQHPVALEAVTDKMAFRNFIHSFVANALEYTPRDGRVEISVKAKEKTFLVSIKDTGIGIPLQEHDAIFQKFGRASNARKIKPDGTGLGLYIAKQAAELLGGAVWFESSPGRGTTFFAELPYISRMKKGGKRLV